MQAKSKTVILKNAKSVILRSATSADAQNMLIHLRLAHTESYRNLNRRGDYWSNFKVEEEAKILSDFESTTNRCMLAAFFGDSIVGALGLFGGQSDFQIKNASIGMSIQQSFCNSGLGTEILRYAMTIAKDAGLHRLDLTVRTFNTAGIALYEKMGFQRIGLLKEVAFIDGQYFDEFSYQLILE